MKFQQRSNHCVETGRQAVGEGLGWVEGGDGAKEREGDLASPQGSSHILSLSSPALLLFLLFFPPSPPLAFLLIPPPNHTPVLASPPLFASRVESPRLTREQSTMTCWSPVSHKLEQQTNGHFVSLRNCVPGSPFSTIHWINQPQGPGPPLDHTCYKAIS